MVTSLRRERLASYLKKALASYFSENADKIGPIFVSEVIVSEDMRQADIFVESLDNSKVNVSKINSSRSTLIEYLKAFFKIKFLPKIHFWEK